MHASLDGRVVLVLGAGSSGDGLSNGQAAALTYARAGAVVVAVDRDPARAEEIAGRIRAEGGRAVWFAADVTVEDDVERVVASVASDVGVPGVLHNNVGIVTAGSVVDLARSAWDATLAVNLTSVYLACRAVLPHMLGAGRGVIVNVSSVAGIRDTGYVYPVYSATKAAVNQLTVSLALTYAGRGIRANAVLPGLIDTPLTAGFGAEGLTAEQARARRDALSPTGRMGTPWDVARAALFLASDDAAYVNGVCLPVDGGLSARCG
ncbi:SDR family NAD(P)-dependent oxidoreductase [Kineosporia sp. A_224]|uniref:SDR family NAD(P)-dependent oxidoreductase n=1 Tax=Kineosporia sp. A_224 TaxID=1962180 RepID=UPI000B4BB481|nr:SDR family NAD(P)-dependent oxidoreductase [Kineosporia sp. A_224]